MSEDKREHQRFKIEQMIELSYGKETYLQATGVDISEGGLLCQSNKHIDPYTELFIMIGLQRGNQDHNIKCEGTVIRSVLDKEKDRYEVGVSFTGMESGDKELLKSFISMQE